MIYVVDDDVVDEDVEEEDEEEEDDDVALVGVVDVDVGAEVEVDKATVAAYICKHMT